jgi:hypothetical protein
MLALPELEPVLPVAEPVLPEPVALVVFAV